MFILIEVGRAGAGALLAWLWHIVLYEVNRKPVGLWNGRWEEEFVPQI